MYNRFTGSLLTSSVAAGFHRKYEQIRSPSMDFSSVLGGEWHMRENFTHFPVSLGTLEPQVKSILKGRWMVDFCD